MAEKKKRSFRKEYLNDFSKDTNGKYVYTGTYMSFSGDRQSWIRENIFLWLCCAVPAILVICVGVVPGSGLIGNPFMLAPYAVSFIVLFIIIWKMVRFSYAGVKMRSYVHDQTVKVIPVYAVIMAVTGGAEMAGMIVSLILGTFNGTVIAVILYIVAGLTQIGGGIFIKTRMPGLIWTRE